MPQINLMPLINLTAKIQLVSFVFWVLLFSTAIQPCSGQVNVQQPGPDTLVICASEFQNALKPWIDYRQQQGHRIVVRFPKPTSFEIKQMIKQVAASGSLKNVVLVGDSFDQNANRQQLVPTDFIKAKVNVKFGSEPDIATDNTYADLDDDGIPDLTIGRLPVDSSAELSNMINRLIEYENGAADESWRRNISLVAGVGGFGGLVDKIIEHTTKQIITDLIPADHQTTMTYGSWSSPYCPDPRQFSETSIARFNEGCMFWVYLGHGSREQLDKIFLPDQSHVILDKTNVDQLHCTNGSPIAICLACYTGATDDPEDGLAETMIRQPRGPIGVVCGSRVTMPYAMSVLSLELLNEFFRGDSQTLGELMLVSKQRMVREPQSGDEYREMIEALGKTFSPEPELLAAERQEHAHLMHLLGDPLLRLKRPAKMQLTARKVGLRQVSHEGGKRVTPRVDLQQRKATKLQKVEAGQRVRIQGVAESAGKLQIEICYQRDRFRHRPSFRGEYDSSDESFRKYQKEYMKAHDLVCSRQTIEVPQGDFDTEIQIPEDASGRCDIRTMLIGMKSFALGTIPIDIKPAPPVRTALRK
jgi:hypothetical protein